MLFYWSLSESKFPQVSRTLLSILAGLNNAVVWIVSTLRLISKSSSHFLNHLVSVPSAPTTIRITVTFMFHTFFSSLARYRYLSLFFLSFSSTLWSAGTAKHTLFGKFSFFWWLSLCLVAKPRLGDPFVILNPREVCASQFPGRILFLFSGYFCFVDTCNFCIVSGRCDQSSPALFYVVFESSYWCIYAIFNAGKSSFSSFSWRIQSVHAISGI